MYYFITGGTQDEEDVIIAQGGKTSDMWLSLESSRERRHWLPWEQDPEDCEDPERMVAFDDISNHLFIINSPEGRFYLVLQFLKFLGMPCTHEIILQQRYLFKKSDTVTSDDVFRPMTLENLLDDKLFGRTEKLAAFISEGGQGILNFKDISPTLMDEFSVDYYTFVYNVLQRASDAVQQPYRTELMILFIKLLGLRYEIMKDSQKDDIVSFCKDLKKKVKNILKLPQFRMCLPIYLEYGKLEEIMGHPDDSVNVFTTALTLGTSSGRGLDVSNPNFKNLMSLYTSYLEIEMKREGQAAVSCHNSNVLCSLASFVLEGKFLLNEGAPTSGPIILKAKKELQEKQNSSLISALENTVGKGKDERLLLSAKLTSFLALLQLFTTGFRAACSVYETSLKNIEEGIDKPHSLEDVALPGEKPMKSESAEKSPLSSKAHLLESIIEEFLWFLEVSSRLDHVAGGERMSPAHMRSILTLAVKVAPHNQKFWLHFALNQVYRI